MRSNFKRWSGALLLILIVCLVGAYASLAHMRETAIHDIAVNAGANDDNIVPTLIRYLESDDTPAKEKNRAIWALGELRDERALPTLERLFASGKCDHDRYVCKREVTKALRKINDEVPNPYL